MTRPTHNRRRTRSSRVAWLTALLVLLLVAAVRAQTREAADDDVAIVQVDFITTPIVVPDEVEQLWKYLESATLHGPSVKLLALNGLRIGKLEVRFRKEFDEVLGRMAVTRRMPQTVQMLPGRPQDFTIGPTVSNRTLFVWKSPTSFLGRRFSRARHGLTLVATPAAMQRCALSIQSVVRHGESLRDRLDLGFLAVETTLETGESIVLCPTAGAPRGLGAPLFWGVARKGRRRTFVILTLTTVRKTETD